MRKTKIFSILRTALLLAVGLVLGINVYSWNARSLTGNAVPMPFGFGMATVLSGSMEPSLSVGDLLIICEQDHYEINDIVVYQSGKTPVVHRIVALDDETVTTRGDANNVADEPFPVTAIKGAVVAEVPFVGHIFWALKKPGIVIALLVVTVLLVEYSFRRGKSEQEEELEKIKNEIRALKEELYKD